MNVSASCWKVAVILPSGEGDVARIGAGTRVIAILGPNDDALIEGKIYRDFLVMVNEIEKVTSRDFLSNVPREVQKTLEDKVYSGRAPSQAKTSSVDGN